MLLYRKCKRDIGLSQDWTKEDTKPNVQKHSCKSKVSHHKVGGLKKGEKQGARTSCKSKKSVSIDGRNRHIQKRDSTCRGSGIS